MQHLEHDDCSWRARVPRHCRVAKTVEMGIRSLVPIYAPTPLASPTDRGAILSAMPHRILSLLLPLLPISVEAETLTGKVVGVTDGDTITVLVAERPIKIRLAEIDTPERKQPWGTRAKQALSKKVFGENVRCEW
jgi:endonuclease YncB( thermonuclease family)